MPNNPLSRALGALAVLLAVGSIVLIVSGLRAGLNRPEPKVLTGGKAWESVELIPAEQLKKAFDDGKSQMQLRNHSGNRWQIASKITSWIAFLCATFITALAAWFGRDAVAAGTPVEQALAQTRTALGRYSWIAGICAAAIAAATAISDRARNEATEYYKASDSIHTIIVQTRQNLQNAKTKEEADGALDDMSRLIGRL